MNSLTSRHPFYKNTHISKNPSIGEWLSKLLHIQAMEYYSPFKKHRVVLFVLTWEIAYGILVYWKSNLRSVGRIILFGLNHLYVKTKDWEVHSKQLRVVSSGKSSKVDWGQGRHISAFVEILQWTSLVI